MAREIRYAGLNSEMEQRLRLAATALAAHGISARATAWDGTRCDAIAVDSSDAYGRQVLDIGRRRGTPIIDLGVVASAQGTTVVRLAHKLVELLRESRLIVAVQDSPGPSAASSATGLVDLANDASLLGKGVEARFRNIAVWLLPDSGRVISATLSDQLYARTYFASESGWTFKMLPTTPQARPRPPGETSGSLDAFLVHSAWQARERLPTFVLDNVSLRDWPDLGAAESVVEALTVAMALQRGPTNMMNVARRCGISEGDVSACLWAFKAGGLLKVDSETHAPEEAQASVPSAKSSGLFARLASHFGLSR